MSSRHVCWHVPGFLFAVFSLGVVAFVGMDGAKMLWCCVGKRLLLSLMVRCLESESDEQS